MALVITLIMLAVTLTLVVAFLAISRRGRIASTTATDTTTARLATKAALAAVESRMAADILATGNPYNVGLLVSTNYVDPAGYNPANLGNAFPRVPVFVKTNAAGPLDFRFFLDLNRNGRFESNGWVAEMDATGATNGNFVFAKGDPEWIGVLTRPDVAHGPNNQFLSRYAYFAQSLDGLDLNTIHNQAKATALFGSQPNRTLDGFFRNQGVGSWEINLAAFLTDLNTNQWNPIGNSYLYNTNTAQVSQGAGFDDALALLRYRYNGDYNTLAPANNYFINTGYFPFNVDAYSAGKLQTAVDYNAGAPLSLLNSPWAGAENTNRFFVLTSDLFNPAKSSINFVSRLQNTSTNLSTYDRYTFYRLLEQLGTDSLPDSSGKMNLNFRNIVNGTVVPGLETNLQPWAPLDFFTNAADRLLQHYTAYWRTNDFPNYTNTFGSSITNAFGVANIPVYVQGQFVYSPAVNRALQLAANIYDASTNSPWPSVFRPVFNVVVNGTNRDVFITDFTYVPTVAGPNDPNYLNTPADAAAVAALNTGAVLTDVNVYGVPWIIGAKKNLPSFNRFDMRDVVQVTRKLQVTRPVLTLANPTPGLDTYQTNQMYIFSVSNTLACSLWNSYTSAYSGNLSIVVRDTVSMALTNDAPMSSPPQFNNYQIVNTLNTNYWPGTKWAGDPPVTALDPTNGSFIIPLNLPLVLLTNSVYRFAGAGSYFDPVNPGFQTDVYTPQLPQFGLVTTNRLQVFILDGNHVIDYVHLAGPNGSLNLNAELADPDTSGAPPYLWSTNGNPTPQGVLDQIAISRGLVAPPNSGGRWVAPPNLPVYLPQTPAAEQAFFAAFFNVNRLKYGQFAFGGKIYTNTDSYVQAAFTPTRIVYDHVSWQANDPLVHYLASDLTYSDGNTGIQRSDDVYAALPAIELDNITQRYSPWGKAYPGLPGDSLWQMQMKDPLLWRPDNWDFPSAPYPSVGWLGRVHRGTPWQTVYLKASDILTNRDSSGLIGVKTWVKWTGDSNVRDALNSAPLTDGALFDLFTTSLSDHATRGTLSVNAGASSFDGGLAAWSALFSGVVVLSNSAPGFFGYDAAPAVTSQIIDPAGVAGLSSPLGQLVNGIKTKRYQYPNHVFTELSDILRVPELTEQSPFLNWNNATQQKYQISDALYEWLPQQTVGLLRLGAPRFVVYCYGEALRPAPGGMVLSGPNFKTITNYQVVAESAARAVIRVEQADTKHPRAVVESFNLLPPD